MRRFAVIGLGRFGSQLARALAQAGAEVIAIDKDRKLVEQISNEVTVAVRLDSTDENALRAQGIDEVDAVVVGIGNDFEANILTTVTLKALKVKYICARAEREVHAAILRRIGADEVIFPEDESAQRLSFKLVAPHISDKLEFAPGYSLVQYAAPAAFDGKTLAQLQLRRKYKVNVITLRRCEDTGAKGDQMSGEIINVPQPDTVVQKGDLLWLVGADADFGSLPEK